MYSQGMLHMDSILIIFGYLYAKYEIKTQELFSRLKHMRHNAEAATGCVP